MTIQERNDYLNEQSWFTPERQHLFDMSNFKVGTKYNNFGQILQVAGIGKDEKQGRYRRLKEDISHFLCTQKQSDGQIKITKVKGEFAENQFSWDLRSPLMGNGYMLDMMIIYILDNHINQNWSKDKWCEALGLLVANKDDYDLTELKYPKSYFNIAYECMKQIAHTRLHDTLVSLEKRGIIKRRTKIVCRSSFTEPFREFTEKEKQIYEETLKKTLHTTKDIDITTAKIYPDAYPKFIESLTKHEEFENLYYRFVIEPEYLYPEEHSYMREFEFYMYQRRLQKNLKPKVLKLAQSRKDKLISSTVERFHYGFAPMPKLDPKVGKELTDAYKNTAEYFWTKQFSRYGTDVRKVVDFLFKGGKKHWVMTVGYKPRIGS